LAVRWVAWKVVTKDTMSAAYSAGLWAALLVDKTAMRLDVAMAEHWAVEKAACLESSMAEPMVAY